jgi:hypothetical protein
MKRKKTRKIFLRELNYTELKNIFDNTSLRLRQ